MSHSGLRLIVPRHQFVDRRANVGVAWQIDVGNRFKGDTIMLRFSAIATFILILGLQTHAEAGTGSRWRTRTRSRVTAPRTNNSYRSASSRIRQTSRDYQASRTAASRTQSTSRSYRSSSSQRPWYINSEPAFRSQRARILYSFSGYPNAFD